MPAEKAVAFPIGIDQAGDLDIIGIYLDRVQTQQMMDACVDKLNHDCNSEEPCR